MRCARIFNRMGISALRLSKPYHDIRRPAELERSDYAVSANIGRTISACRQAVVDIRCCLDWLEEQGYEHFGVLGTSLGSCYAFLASAHDAAPAGERLQPRVHVRLATWCGRARARATCAQALEEAGLTQDRVRALWAAHQPRAATTTQFAGAEADGPAKKVLVVYADYDLTFPREYSLQVVEAFRPHRRQLRAARAALRPLHHRRNAVQVHRRLVPGLVRLSRLQGAARREKAAARRPPPKRKKKPSRGRVARPRCGKESLSQFPSHTVRVTNPPLAATPRPGKTFAMPTFQYRPLAE